jgi:hypothetical protein
MINSKNFDNIRSVALIFILLLHTILFYNPSMIDLYKETSKELFYLNFEQLLLNSLYYNIFKPGTILFFIIAGFLFQMQFLKFDNFYVFLKKKAKSLLRPYLIIFVIPTIFLIIFVYPYVGAKENTDNIEFSALFIKIMESIFLTNYWFVPALFVTLIINFFIKTKDLFIALALFIAIWLIAYLNIYFKFVMTSHTVWFVGFFFVFTLGRLMFIYNDKISNLSIIKDPRQLFLICVLFYIFSNLESLFIMYYAANADYVNTLKIGNLFYSFALFYMLNYGFSKSNFVVPLNLSFYFIYLIHPFILRITSYVMEGYNLKFFQYPMQFIYNFLHFLFVLLICIVIHQIFFKLSFKSKALSQYVFKK